ncbi:MAG: PAS domain S-box protein [Acidobacteria bacterium]|nr:PAS domain S-box protein [Acidobacteriota bacterium]
MKNDVEEVTRGDLAVGAEDALHRAICDSLSTQIAVLDNRGRIIAVNEAWTRFADENGGAPVGTSYFDAYGRASGADAAEAQAALAGIRAVLDGSTTRFALEYPCRSPGEERWFLMSVEPLRNRPACVVVSHLNITESRRAEQELKQSENKYRLLMEHASDGIHTYDLDGNFIDVNSKLCEMLDYTREEMLRLNVRDFVLAEDLAVAPIRFEELRAGKSLITERRLRRRDGTFLPVEISGRMTETGMLQAIIRDISARKHAEEALLESNEFNKQIIASAREGIIVYDRELRYVVWNPYMEEVTGLRAEKVLGRSPFDLFPFLRAQEVEPLLRRALGGEVVSLPDIAYSIPHTDKTGWTSSRYSPLRDAKGAIIGLLVVVHDITERKRAEDELRESEERFRQLAENIKEVFWLSDMSDKGLIYVSGGYERVWGRPCENLYDAPDSWLEAVHPDDRERVREAVLNKQPVGTYDEEYCITRPDGALRWIHDRAFPIADESGQVYRIAGIAADITERKLGEAALRASEERFFKAFNVSPVPMSINRLEDGSYLYVNDSFLKVTKYTREEIIGHSTLELNLWDDPREGLRLVGVLEDAGRISEAVVNFRMKSGDVRTGLFSAEIIEVGGERCILSLTSDITEHKRSERRLTAQFAITRVLAEAATLNEATERILRAICESLGLKLGALWFVDQESDVLRCVEIWCDDNLQATEFEHVSRTAAFPRNTGFPSHVWASRRPLWVADIASDSRFPRSSIAAREGLHAAVGFPVILGEEILGVMEFFCTEVRPPDHELLNMMSTIGSQIGQFAVRKRAEAALKEAHDELEVRVVERTAELGEANRGLQAEVAERKRTENALRQSEEFNARIIESSSDCIKVLDLEGRLLYVNPNGQKLLEMCDFASYLNCDWVSFWEEAEQQHARDAIVKAKAGGIGSFQGFCPTTQGTPKWWDVVVTPITDAEGRVERLLSTSRDITERKRAEEARAEWTRQLVTAQEDERRRIARELHDQTGQHLTAIMLGLSGLKNLQPPPSPSAVARLGQLHDSVEQLGKELHRLAWELRPAMLDDLGLLTALSNYVEEWSERARVPADFHSLGVTKRRLPPQIETTVYRIAQEALTNILRHAEARHVSVILEQRQDHLLAIVEDDGKGFDVEALGRVPVAERRLGVLGMRERAALVGGALDIESAPGQGTTLYVRMPVPVGIMEAANHE